MTVIEWYKTDLEQGHCLDTGTGTCGILATEGILTILEPLVLHLFVTMAAIYICLNL